MAEPSPNESTRQQIAAFRNQAVSLARLLRDFGCRQTFPFRDPDCHFFRRLGEAEQRQVLKWMDVYTTILNEVLAQGGTLRNNRVAVWAAAKNLGYRPRSDFFDKIGDNDIVEFYDASGIQVFRNLNFFDVSSYTIEDVFTRSYQELYYRPPEVQGRLDRLGQEVCLGAVVGTVPTGLPLHVLRETDSALGFNVELNIRYISPLASLRGEGTGAAVIEDGRVINEFAPGEVEARLADFYAQREVDGRL